MTTNHDPLEDLGKAARIVKATGREPAEAFAMIHSPDRSYQEAPELAAYSGTKCYACTKCGCRLPGQLGYGPPCNCANEEIQQQQMDNLKLMLDMMQGRETPEIANRYADWFKKRWGDALQYAGVDENGQHVFHHTGRSCYHTGTGTCPSCYTVRITEAEMTKKMSQEG